MNALPKIRSADTLPEFNVVSFQRLAKDRHVAEVRMGPILLGSIYLTGCQSKTPQVVWPRTVRGYPVIVVDEPLRSEIETALIRRLGEGGV